MTYEIWRDVKTEGMIYGYKRAHHSAAIICTTCSKFHFYIAVGNLPVLQLTFSITADRLKIPVGNLLTTF